MDVKDLTIHTTAALLESVSEQIEATYLQVARRMSLGPWSTLDLLQSLVDARLLDFDSKTLRYHLTPLGSEFLSLVDRLNK